MRDYTLYTSIVRPRDHEPPEHVVNLIPRMRIIKTISPHPNRLQSKTDDTVIFLSQLNITQLRS